MSMYERYLFAVFLLSLVIRFHQYRLNLGFAWKFPTEFPQVFDIVKQHRQLLLNWTTLYPATIALCVMLAHSLSLRLVFRGADVTPNSLQVWWLPQLAVLIPAVCIVFCDLRALTATSSTDFEAIERDLSRGEFVLTSRSMWMVRIGTLGLVNPRRIVESRIADTLQGVRWALLRQLKAFAMQTMLRISLGLSLWLSYALLTAGISRWLYFWGLLAVWAGLFGVWRWAKRNTIAPGEPAE